MLYTIINLLEKQYLVILRKYSKLKFKLELKNILKNGLWTQGHIIPFKSGMANGKVVTIFKISI